MEEIIRYVEDQASRDSQEYWGMAIQRCVAGIEDLNAYKDQASDGNEESGPEILFYNSHSSWNMCLFKSAF